MHPKWDFSLNNCLFPQNFFYSIKLINFCYLIRSNSVGPIVDVKMVVAVHLQEVEAQHEPLQDRMRLERYDTVQVPLVLGPKDSAIDFPIELLEEVILAQ